MPRRNRPRRTWHPAASTPEPEPKRPERGDCEHLARDLVRRKLASPLILDGASRYPFTQREENR